MGSNFSHLNVSNVHEIISADLNQAMEVYYTTMKLRGVLNEEEETLFSKGEDDTDFDIAYTAPQNYIARTDFLIKVSEISSVFIGWHFSGNVIATRISSLSRFLYDH